MSEDHHNAATADAPADDRPQNTTESASPPEGRRVQVGLRLDESDLKTAYANAFQARYTAEEIVFDLGMNVTTPRPTPPPPRRPNHGGWST